MKSSKNNQHHAKNTLYCNDGNNDIINIEIKKLKTVMLREDLI